MKTGMLTWMPVFTDQLKAVQYAASEVPESCRGDADWEYELTPSMTADGWIRYIPYSEEGDFVRVMRRTVKE